VYINHQSPEIAQGVDEGGAGDQGMMFGYACRETPELMPLPIMMAHQLARRLDEAHAQLKYLRPDGKAQVTVRYQGDTPVKVEHITLAKPHDEATTLAEVKADLWDAVVKPTLDEFGFNFKAESVVLNGTGVWHHPGPASDAGLTGRKIIVDTYGGYARVGGGAFSGKDATKVDRSGAYAARYIAKNLVHAGLADRAEVGLAYFIGAHQPVMKHVETFGTAHASAAEIQAAAGRLIDTSVSGIIKALALRQPQFAATAAYGHFGRPGFSWEQIAKR
jgi:S-adenosylmethionine synthetase